MRLGFTHAERLGYIAVTGGEDVEYLPEMDHRLLGYPYTLEPFTFTAAYMAAHGIGQDQKRHRGELDRQADQEWRLLLQVYSNDEAQMDWAGGGVIHFGIQRTALAAHDFSRVWVSLQFL
jgi:hypothetical protein